MRHPIFPTAPLGRLRLVAGLAIAALVALAGACDDSDDAAGVASSAELNFASVTCEDTSAAVVTAGAPGLQYAAEIAAGDEWLSFSPTEALAAKNGDVGRPIPLYFARNTSSEARHATIDVRFTDGYAARLAFTQGAYSSSALYDRAWAEQPAKTDDEDLVYVTHYTTLSNGEYVRNYSICYDTERCVSRWVAYPLHKVYITPNLGRPDPEPWSYDPEIGSSPQANLKRSYSNAYGNAWRRGHQLPSADRYNTSATNAQTYYSTNIMPQDDTFNGSDGAWFAMENAVRANICRDTLYVVTGTYFGDSRTTTDRDGKRIAIPSYCWKVMLRTRSGSTGKPIQECSADELMAIGFWAPNDASSRKENTSEYLTSVAFIEEQTHFTFFRNLPEEAAAVKEQCRPSDWGL